MLCSRLDLTTKCAPSSSIRPDQKMFADIHFLFKFFPYNQTHNNFRIEPINACILKSYLLLFYFTKVRNK
jgi:hypothetical protein